MRCVQATSSDSSCRMYRESDTGRQGMQEGSTTWEAVIQAATAESGWPLHRNGLCGCAPLQLCATRCEPTASPCIPSRPKPMSLLPAAFASKRGHQRDEIHKHSPNKATGVAVDPPDARSPLHLRRQKKGRAGPSLSLPASYSSLRTAPPWRKAPWKPWPRRMQAAQPKIQSHHSGFKRRHRCLRRSARESCRQPGM